MQEGVGSEGSEARDSKVLQNTDFLVRLRPAMRNPRSIKSSPKYSKSRLSRERERVRERIVDPRLESFVTSVTKFDDLSLVVVKY